MDSDTRAQECLNPYILRMFEGTFSLNVVFYILLHQDYIVGIVWNA